MSESSKLPQLSIIQKILKESEAYTSLDFIQSSIESGGDLSQFPTQPLYTVIKSLPSEKVGALLARLGQRQRQSFLDLDLWHRDNLDVEGFSYWISAYANCPEDRLQEEFVESSEFSLFLKGRFNIWTFDEEDPLYPDHDNYFLSDDAQLLFEFDEDFEQVAETRELIRRLYSLMGVEDAYSYLFKLTVDSFMSFQEEEYQKKKYRLAELGFVDHFDALDVESCYSKPELLKSALHKAMQRKTANINNLGKQQALHSTSLVAFKENDDIFSDELNKVQDEKRSQYLRFNFIRLVNASMVSQEALKSGKMAMTRVGKNTRAFLRLGFDYLQTSQNAGEFQIEKEESLFDYFDFIDLYRFGHSLVEFVRKDLGRALRETPFGDYETSGFLGRYLGEIIDFSYEKPPQVLLIADGGKSTIVNNLQYYEQWKDQAKMAVEILPFAHKFYVVYEDLRSHSKLSDAFYLNYTVNEIDLEAILLSSFANFTLSQKENKKQTQNKMGLTITEFQNFCTAFLDKNGEVDPRSDFQNQLDLFLSSYGLSEVYNIKSYFGQILSDHLGGYDFNELSENDYRHVGGPIIFDPGQ